MKRLMIPLLAAALLSAACGDSPTAPSPTQGKPLIGEQPTVSAVRLHTLNADACGDPTYVGPIRLPISVHGTGFDLSWLGNDGATRGYQLEIERYDVTNVWVFAFTDIAILPEYSGHVRTHGTYRVRVRGLFCNDQVGGFTDWVVFSTDGEPDNTPGPPPIICLTSVYGCGNPPPPPCLIDCGGDEGDHDNGHGNDDDGDDEDNPGNGGPHNAPPPIDPPCNLHPTSNPHGGDHNDDGHNDCGHGHN
jgi:hypothetical protein